MLIEFLSLYNCSGRLLCKLLNISLQIVQDGSFPRDQIDMLVGTALHLLTKEYQVWWGFFSFPLWEKLLQLYHIPQTGYFKTLTQVTQIRFQAPYKI